MTPTQWTIAKLSCLAVAMFVFAMWVMPPLYTLFCEVTGLNSKYLAGKAEAVESTIDTSRTVRVKFISTKNAEMPWGFQPENFYIDVHPGEAIETKFIAMNPTQDFMVGQAIPSINPNNATNYFHKTECFCFNSQVLAPGEEADLGLVFIVDQELPKSVKSIVLSYTLFDITEASPEQIEQKKKSMQGTTDRIFEELEPAAEPQYAMAH
jgi:cytochrome c oxidase assembly protein subunit 11